MTRLRLVRAVVGVGCLTMLMTVDIPAASAHTHPAPPDLTAPAVVYLQSGYHVKIALIEHNVTAAHINLIKRTYDPVLTQGSGFVVNPSAVVVTTSATISSDEQAAKNVAINSLFQETYGASAPPLPADARTQRSFTPDVGSPNDYSTLARLKACYDERTNSAGGCVIYASPFTTVYPYVTDQSTFGALDAKVLKTTPSGIAVLRVSAGSMPAVSLADSDATTYHLWVFGFHGAPPGGSALDTVKAHLNKVGGTVFKAPTPPSGDNNAFAKVTPTMLANGLQGGPVAGELGQVLGMISATPVPAGKLGAGQPTLIRTADIRAVLTGLGVTNTHSPADDSYDSAMHKFNNNGYAASISGFRNALAAYPGHYLAALHLKQAEAKVAAGATAGPSSPQVAAAAPTAAAASTSHVNWWRSWAWWAWVLIALALIVLVLVTSWLVRGRRRPKAGPHPKPRAAGSPSRSAVSGTGAGTGTPPGRRSHPRGEPVAAPAASSSGNGAQAGTAGAPSGAGRAVASRRRESTAHADPTVLAQTAVPASGGGARTAKAAARAPAFCTNCGGRLAPHHQFCGWCGDSVG